MAMRFLNFIQDHNGFVAWLDGHKYSIYPNGDGWVAKCDDEILCAVCGDAEIAMNLCQTHDMYLKKEVIE